MELNIYERLGLDSLVNQQQGTLEELEILLDIKRKLGISPQLRQDLILPIPGGVQFNDKLAESIGSLDIPFEKAERKKLIALIRSWRMFTLNDLSLWVSELIKKLEAES